MYIKNWCNSQHFLNPMFCLSQNHGLDGVTGSQGTVARLSNNTTRHDASSTAEGAQTRRRQAGNRKRVGAAVPTRKAAMRIEHGAGSGGVDVRDGQASVRTCLIVCLRCFVVNLMGCRAFAIAHVYSQLRKMVGME